MVRYLDPNLSPEERADDLLQRMSIEEKMGQVVGYISYMGSSEGLESKYPQGAGTVSMLFTASLSTKEEVIDKIVLIQQKIMELSENRIPAFFHIETLAGALLPEATSFPSGIGQASTWNPKLQKEMAKIMSRQARAVGATHAFAPVLDIARDPRFGRYGETYGEDPTLAAAMGVAYVEGLQQDGRLEEGVLACAKHFLGYHMSQGGMHAAPTPIPPRMLREVYAKPFQAAVTEADMKSIMNAYNSIDGEPVAGSAKILRDLLREEMGFRGLIVADYGSIKELHTRHRVSESFTDAGELALRAGIDIELPEKLCYNDELMERMKSGELDIALLDEAVRRILVLKFATGLFEEPFPVRDERIELAYRDPACQKISLEVARQSIVLLKNDNHVLPLQRKKQKIAVIGYHADSLRALFGGYSFTSSFDSLLNVKNSMAGVDFAEMSGKDVQERLKEYRYQTYPGSTVQRETPQSDEMIRKYYPECRTLLEQLRLACPEAEIRYAYGYDYAGNDTSKHDEALEIAKDADVVILTLGGKAGWGTLCTTGEGIDATSINLPECQELFIAKLATLNKPSVAIHFDGRPISSDLVDQHIDAILEAWTPGENGAEAIVDILFGKANPSGKLPVSIPYNSGQIPLYYNHHHGASYNVGTENEFKSYLDCPREPRYYFGHGLSYTTFVYSNLQISKDIYEPDEDVVITVDVSNTGTMAGEEVVQLYIRDPYASVVRPVQELAGFCRVPLEAGETKRIRFTMKSSQLAFLDKELKWKIEAGEIEIMVGASSRDIRLRGDFRIAYDKFIDGKSRGFYAKAEIIPS